jgi:hypothetical protein
MHTFYFARLFPYSPREGFKVRNYTIEGLHFKGGPRPAWYKITPEQKALLEPCRQTPDDRYSKPMFQFANPDQMEAIEQQERAQVIAASMLQKGMVIDPDIIPKSRTIDFTGGLDDTGRITGGRADAIPPARDTRPDSVKTATYEADDAFADADADAEMADEGVQPKPSPALTTADLPVPRATTEPKAPRPPKTVARRVMPQKPAPQPVSALLPKPLGSK